MLGGLAVCAVGALTACASGDETTSATPNLLTTVRSQLTNYSDVEVFRVSSDTESYWRLTVLPEFDGETWRVPESELEYIGDLAGRTPEGREIRQEIEVRALGGSFVPVAPEPTQASSPADELRWSEALGALFARTELAPGDRFEIVSRSPDHSAQELRAATTDDPPGAGYTDLPSAAPAILAETAKAITADAGTDYDRLLMLQRWFQTEFEYSLEVQAGHGYSAIEGLLRTRVGHSEHFASAFAVLARTLGAPSRVAVGFTPGELRPDGWYSVSNRHAHVWPEIWFNGLGWVPFEPTPASRSPTTPSVPATSAPSLVTTTDPRAEPGWTGDPFAATEPSTASRTTIPDSGPTATSEPPAPSDAGSDTGRPLTDLTTGDVVVPTYIPSGLTLKRAKILERGGWSEFSFLLERADPQYEYSTDFTVILSESPGTLLPLGSQFLNDPDHPPVDIAGVTWGWNDFFVVRTAHIGSFEVWVSFDALDTSEAERLIEGLRALPIDQFPVPISFNGVD